MSPHILKGKKKKSPIGQTKHKHRVYLGTALISATVAGRTLKKEHHSITECKLALLSVHQASKLRDEVLGQGTVTFWESQQTKKMEN